MATQSYSGGGARMRFFDTGREGFTETGKPVFREWLRNGPPPESQQKGRRFEKNDKGQWYENFGALTKCLLADYGRVEKSVTRKGKEVKEIWFFIVLFDAETGEKYKVHFGNLYGRYALNLMARFCNEEFNPQMEFDISPYSFIPEGGSLRQGINLVQAGNKIEARKREDEYFEVPRATENKYTKNGQPVKDLDFTPVGNWLFDFLDRNVKQYLQEPEVREALSTNDRQNEYQQDDRFPKEEHAPAEGDDLPF